MSKDLGKVIREAEDAIHVYETAPWYSSFFNTRWYRKAEETLLDKLCALNDYLLVAERENTPIPSETKELAELVLCEGWQALDGYYDE